MCVAPRAGGRALLAAHPSMKVLSARYSFSAARSTPIVAGLFGVWGLRRNLETRRAGDGRGDGRGESKDARGSDCCFGCPWSGKQILQVDLGSAMMRPCPVCAAARLSAAARPQFWPLVLRRCRSPAEATADAAP